VKLECDKAVPSMIRAAVVPPHTYGHQSKLGHITRVLIPNRFYNQLDVNDMHMLFVPSAFQ
jgi:hypothetical protein